MRLALVSPYSYTYPGGVGRHVEALADQLIREGHDVRLISAAGACPRAGQRPDPRVKPFVRRNKNDARECVGLQPTGLTRGGDRHRGRPSGHAVCCDQECGEPGLARARTVARSAGVAEMVMILTKWHLMWDRNSQLLEGKSWARNRVDADTSFCWREKWAEEAETPLVHYISR